MSTTASGGARWRNNPFDRDSASPSPGSTFPSARPKSAVFTPPSGSSNPAAHSRNQSFSPHGASTLAPLQHIRQRSNSHRTSNQSSNTFAPQFIKTEELQRTGDKVGAIEGENDFSGKRYVWLRDPQTAFVKGWIVEELVGGRLLVQCDDGTVRRSDLTIQTLF